MGNIFHLILWVKYGLLSLFLHSSFIFQPDGLQNSNKETSILNGYSIFKMTN
jgi:hypothetical protein